MLGFLPKNVMLSVKKYGTLVYQSTYDVLNYKKISQLSIANISNSTQQLFKIIRYAQEF
jgi:hypothetical protein